MNLHKLKLEICEIGRRLYNKGFAAANDGNISYRIGPNEVLCTPTMVSKGFLKPEDLCTVDLEGKQLSGTKKRTSEILLHLSVMKEAPEVKSVVHCHPPHATAFAIAREPIPQCVLPEVEVFLGDVPMTRYETPGGQKFADTIIPFVKKSKVAILTNHGTISWGDTVEHAYWWTEILDAYCRMLMLARNLGKISYFNQNEAQELLDLKQRLGIDDPRLWKEMENCDICANDMFRDSWSETGVSRGAFVPPDPMPARTAAAAASASSNGSLPSASSAAKPDQEALVQAITDRVMAALSGR